jgi:alanine-alpha-ketoisovalerate/valine-pyruvate aminotransferase
MIIKDRTQVLEVLKNAIESKTPITITLDTLTMMNLHSALLDNDIVYRQISTGDIKKVDDEIIADFYSDSETVIDDLAKIIVGE